MNIELHTDFEPVLETHDVDGLASPVTQEFNRWLFRFGDKGLSVVCHLINGRIVTYGNMERPFEAALVGFDDYETYFLAEPSGYFTEEDINKMLHKLEKEKDYDF